MSKQDSADLGGGRVSLRRNHVCDRQNCTHCPALGLQGAVVVPLVPVGIERSLMQLHGKINEQIHSTKAHTSQ
jgi:hypothetical protein